MTIAFPPDPKETEKQRGIFVIVAIFLIVLALFLGGVPAKDILIGVLMFAAAAGVGLTIGNIFRKSGGGSSRNIEIDNLKIEQFQKKLQIPDELTKMAREEPAAYAQKEAEKQAAADDSRTVHVFFATNRSRADKDGRLAFAGDLADRLSFGLARVRVPDNHVTGNVERPGGLTSFLLKTLRWDEDQKKYFVVRAIEELSSGSFVSAVQSTHRDSAIVFVHGYNNSFDDGLFRLAQIVFDGQLAARHAPVLFSWPSQNSAAAYNTDAEMAELSEKPFLELLTLLHETIGVKNIHVIAHSMGNRIVLKALDKAIAASAPPLGEVICAAADINRQSFAELGERVSRVSKGMTLYASADDAAMWWSEKVAKQLPRAGSIIDNEPVVVNGVESIDMTAANPAKSLPGKAIEGDLLGLNTHNTFVSPVIVDIARLLTHREHPPHARTSFIRGAPDGAATPKYWFYAKL